MEHTQGHGLTPPARPLPEEHTLTDTGIRAALNFPKSGPRAVLQARFSAIALESDRAVTP